MYNLFILMIQWSCISHFLKWSMFYFLIGCNCTTWSGLKLTILLNAEVCATLPGCLFHFPLSLATQDMLNPIRNLAWCAQESQTFHGTWAHALPLYTGYSVRTSTGTHKAHPHRDTLSPTKPHLLMVPLPRILPQNVSKAVINGILVGFIFEWTTSLLFYK